MKRELQPDGGTTEHAERRWTEVVPSDHSEVLREAIGLVRRDGIPQVDVDPILTPDALGTLLDGSMHFARQDSTRPVRLDRPLGPTMDVAEVTIWNGERMALVHINSTKQTADVSVRDLNDHTI